MANDSGTMLLPPKLEFWQERPKSRPKGSASATTKMDFA